MRKPVFCLIFAFAVMLTASTFVVAQTSRKSVSAAEVNGTFRSDFAGKFKDFSNEAKILALGGGKLRIAFSLIYPIELPNGEKTANLGELEGEASIKGDTAIYQSDEFGPCKITIKFVRAGTIKVTQEGSDADCGFGHNVFSSGTYKKVSSKKPTFESVN